MKWKNTKEENGSFKIFLFILQNNKIFDLELSDNIEYTLHFRNELNNKIDVKFEEMKKEMIGMKDEIKGMKDELIKLIMEINRNYDSKGTNNDNSG